jgi:surface protein
LHGGLVGCVMYVIYRMFALVKLSQYFDQGSSFRLLLLRVDCECNRPSFPATVFNLAVNFNGNISKWDVAKVTTMRFSKSICIVETDLT